MIYIESFDGNRSKKLEEKEVAYIFATGSYEKLPELFGKVVQWVMNRGLEITEPPFGEYYNSLMEVPEDQLQYEVGIPFISEVKEEGRIKIKKFQRIRHFQPSTKGLIMK